MIQGVWCSEAQRTIVCVDSYTDGVIKGRICNTAREPVAFEGLVQFLVRMEELLDDLQLPQADTEKRSFPVSETPIAEPQKVSAVQKGACATFELKVIFRRHTSWQGIVTWQETRQEQSYRSVLELILLMDSALQQSRRREYA